MVTDLPDTPWIQNAYNLSKQLGFIIDSPHAHNKQLYIVGKRHIKKKNKQLLDEAEHDIKNYSERGQCYLPKRS